MNPIEPRAQAALDAAMNLIRTAAASAAMRVAENLGVAAQRATNDLRARPAHRRRSRSCAATSARSRARSSRRCARSVAKDLAPRVDQQAQARVGRLADAQPGRRQRGRGADELRPPRPDDLARVRMAAARPRRLHGRAARHRPRRRRAQPAARRDRRRGAAPAASRRSRASARAAASWRASSARHGRAGDAGVLRARSCACCRSAASSRCT